MLKKLLIFILTINVSSAIANSNTNKKHFDKINIIKFNIDKKVQYSNKNNIKISIDENNNMFILSHCMLYSIDKYGKINHQKNLCITGNKFIYFGSLNSSKDILFAHVGTRELYALNKDNLEEVWKKKLNGYIRGEIGTNKNNELFLNTSDNKLYAIDKKTGGIIWSDLVSKGTPLQDRSNQVVIDDNIILFIYSPSMLSAFDVNGKNLWNKQLDILHKQEKKITFINNSNIFIVNGNSIIEINEKDGEIKWKYDAKDHINSIETDNKKIFSASGNNINAIDINNKSIKWTKKITNQITDIISIKNYLVVFDNKQFIILINSENGEIIEKKKTNLGGKISNIVKHKEMLYIYSHKSNSIEIIAIK